MKINISMAGKPKKGYLSVDPSAVTNDENWYNLDGRVEDSECVELILDNVLEYIPSDILKPYMVHWIQKLRRKGIVCITATDFYEVSKAVTMMSIPTDVARELLFGGQKENWDFKCNQVTVEEVISILKSLGLTILKKRSNAFTMYIEAQRL